MSPSTYLSGILVLATLSGATAANDRMDLDYPELAVTPRSSQRIEMEARKEPSRRWTTFLPTQLSSVTLLTASILRLSGTPNSNAMLNVAPIPGIVVSSAWLATTIGMSLFYTPYLSGWREMSALPTTSQRDQLTKERMAEEVLEHSASLGKKLMWLSFGTQFATSAFLVAGTRTTDIAFPVALGSVLMSFAPILFQYPWSGIYNEQMDYKKKIYAPLASTGLMPVQNASTGAFSLVPSFNLTWNF